MYMYTVYLVMHYTKHNIVISSVSGCLDTVEVYNKYFIALVTVHYGKQCTRALFSRNAQ